MSFGRKNARAKRGPGAPRGRAASSRSAASPGRAAPFRRARGVLAAFAVLLALALAGVGTEAPLAEERATVRVGSKSFTESVILGEIVAQLARASGGPAIHREQLGGTRILFNALLAGEIDIYPEYTGTITQEILADQRIENEEGIRAALAARGVVMSRPLGFNNTYALGMKEEVAARLGIRTISDLTRAPELGFGFSNEFMDRGDGWPALRARYRLPQTDVRGLDHDLAYRALDAGTIAVTDLYSTDAEIQFYGLRVLEDDLRHFPSYRAVLLMRSDLVERDPALAASLGRLEGKITEREMIALNAKAKLERVPESAVAEEFLARVHAIRSETTAETPAGRLARRTAEHIALVAISLAGSILVAIPLGILAARRPRIGHFLLGTVGVIQTIPSLALLAFMIPILGIGAPPAIAAMFLYSLLPIVRNTFAGLLGIPPSLRESAEALGLSPGARLRLVELPLASRSILAGIKTSAVINVGTATLGALIGAGGYGQPILTGIRLANTSLILQGAIPAALLALGVQALFDLSERVLVPRGLRL